MCDHDLSSLAKCLLGWQPGAPGCWWLVTGSEGDASSRVGAARHVVMGRAEGCPGAPGCHYGGCCGTSEGAERTVIKTTCLENSSSRFCRALRQSLG